MQQNALQFIPFNAGDLDRAGKVPGWNWDESSHTFSDPRFGIVQHVLFLRDGQIQNDQMLRVEKGPGTFIPYDPISKTVGLIRHAVRPQLRPEEVKNHEAGWPQFDLTKIGRPSWEFPRGYAVIGETSMETARREGEEETGSAVIGTHFLGRICGNTAMEPHYMTVVLGTVDTARTGSGKPDPNERLLNGLRFFDWTEIIFLVRNGDLYDANTLASLQLLMFMNVADFHL